MSGAEHYADLLAKAAKRLGCGADDPRASDLAALWLAKETIIARLIGGGGNPETLLKLDEAISLIAPRAADKSLKVEIALVDNIAGTCPRCGFAGCEPRAPEPLLSADTQKLGAK
jgi:hypothetical protein